MQTLIATLFMITDATALADDMKRDASLCIGNEHPRCFYFLKSRVLEGSTALNTNPAEGARVVDEIGKILKSTVSDRTKDSCLIPIVLQTSKPRLNRHQVCEESLTPEQRKQFKAALEKLK